MEVPVRVVIASSDSYTDAWRPCLALMDRFWTDRPWPRSIVSNERTATLPDCDVLQTGPDRGWGREMDRALRWISEPVVLLMMEDYFAVRAWDSEALKRDAAWLSANRAAGYLRLVPTPPGDGTMDRTGRYRLHSTGQPWRFALQPALVKRDYALRFLLGYSTPWEFEQYERGAPDAEHWVVADPAATPLHVTGAIRTAGPTYGLGNPKDWQDEALRLCAKLGIACPDPI